MKVDILVLNYNGKELLAECLPSIVKSAEMSRHDCRVKVIDNASSDGSCELLIKEFPGVAFTRRRANTGLSAFNGAAEDSDADVIILMNNDIKVCEAYVDPMVRHFEKREDVLFVAARGYSFDGAEYQGDRAVAATRWGVIAPSVKYPGYELLTDKPGYTLSAGVGAFDRKKFLGLGGYDDIFLPGRYEDVDLCFRGWKSGYVGIYEPASVHYHKGAASFKREYTDDSIAALVFRNAMLFTVKNVTDPALLTKFAFSTAVRLLYYMCTARFNLVGGFRDACRRLPGALRKRGGGNIKAVLTDREIFARVADSDILIQ